MRLNTRNYIEFLSWIDCYIFEYDLTTKTVNYLKNGKHQLANNLTLQEMFKTFIYSENIIDYDIEDFDNVIQSFSNKEYFSVNITLKCKSEKSIQYNFSGIIITKHKKPTIVLGRISKINDIDSKDNHISNLDPLTQVLNRESIIKYATTELEKNNGIPLALMIVDIDYFKAINDTHGHLYGDKVLVRVASAMQNVLSIKGKIGRIGGDEFLIVLHDASDYMSLWRNARMIRESVEGLIFTRSQLKLTCTVGISSYPTDGNDYETIFSKADKALYRGKTKGRNCFIIYNEKKHGQIMTSGKKVDTVDTINNLRENSLNTVINKTFELLSNPNANIRDAIHDYLEIIGNRLGVERIIVYDLLTTKLNLYSVWNSNFYPEFENVDISPSSSIQTILEGMNGQEIMVTNNVLLLKDTLPEMYEIMTKQSTKSIMGTSIKNNNDLLGFIRFDMCSKKRVWQASEEHILSIASKAIGLLFIKLKESEIVDKQLNFDDVTGLYNYSKFMKLASQTLHNSPDTMYTTIYFNFYRFKYLNDKFGFKEGDKVLNIFADALRADLPGDSIYARIIADKFIALTRFTSEKEITDAIKKITRTVSSIMMPNGQPFYLPVLAGVCISKGDTFISDMVDRATIAKKSIKEPQTSEIAFYNEKMQSEYDVKSILEEHMYIALKDEEFLVYLQPKVDIKTREVFGAEALVRWNFKNTGILAPNAFIPLFEKNGFIVNLDFYVFEKVCQLQKSWKENNMTVFPISINLSRAHLDTSGLIENLEDIRKRYDIDPQLLEIEITESLFVTDDDKLKDIITKLHEVGYKISIDDFGSGYSGLNMLSSFETDVLKLDKLFFKDRVVEKDKIILSSIIQMAKNLNMSVIAEGIETKEQEDLSYELGCNKAQGYLYDKPLSINDFESKYQNK